MFENVLIGVFILGALTTVLMIGKERTPITPVMAAVSLVIDGLLIYGVLNWL